MPKNAQTTAQLHSSNTLVKKEEKESEVAQSCPTLCDPVDCSLPGSSVHGILQARILEWVAISFSRGSSQPRDQSQVSRIAGRCFTLWLLSFKPTFRLSSFTFIKSLFSSSLLSAIKVVSSAFLELLIFLPTILIPAFAKTSLNIWKFTVHVSLKPDLENSC